MPHISLAAETLFRIGPMPVTNALVTTWLVMAILIVLAISVNRSVKMVPGNGLSIVETLIGGLYDFFGAILGHHTKMVFPLVASIFLFVMTANYVGLLPGVGTIGFFHAAEATKEHAAVTAEAETVPAETAKEQVAADTHTAVKVDEHAVPAATVKETTAEGGSAHETAAPAEGEHAPTAGHTKFTPLLRGPTADLNMTLALAIVAVIAMQVFGFKAVGPHYSKRFLNFSNPIMFFIGILEIISDTSKVISFAFRLFGNIFAGEVLLSVMAFLMPFIAPMPFLVLELFVGFIQALVFSTLTAVFVNVAVSHEEH